MSLIDRAAPSMRWSTGRSTSPGTWRATTATSSTSTTRTGRCGARSSRCAAGASAARLLEEENAQLRALNNVRLPPRTTFVAGDVIADSGGPFREAVLVNVGRSDRIEDGAAAVDGSGLVGRVVGVGERAVAADAADRFLVAGAGGRSSPGAKRAMLAGDGTPAPKLEFLDGGDRMQPGDLVETSGDGGVFPPDLPVGHVVATPGGTGGWPCWRTTARLEFVRLLRYRPDTAIDRPGDLVRPHAAVAGGRAPTSPGRRAPTPADRWRRGR